MSTQHFYTCEVCGEQSLLQGQGQPAHSCVCGSLHRLCWPCCYLHEISWDQRHINLAVCPISDEFKVAEALMREDPSSGGDRRVPADPERVKVVSERRKQLFAQKAAKQFAADGQSVTWYLDALGVGGEE